VTLLFFVTAWFAGVANRTRRAYTNEVELRARRAEDDQDNRAARAAADERSRIARELHDVVAHHVSLIAVQAEAAASLLPGRPVEAAGSVEIIGTTARQALTELRRLLGVLRNPDEPVETVPSASVDQLDAVVDQLRHAGLDVELTVSGIPRRLSAAIDLTAYRIVQEALTNAVRHAPANPVRVVLSYEPDHVSVTVVDAGDKLTAPTGPGLNGHNDGPAGFGLSGITERVTSCGGTLTIGPTPAGGFAVLAKLPAP
jgi:signal transduction histidine kinase